MCSSLYLISLWFWVKKNLKCTAYIIDIEFWFSLFFISILLNRFGFFFFFLMMDIENLPVTMTSSVNGWKYMVDIFFQFGSLLDYILYILDRSMLTANNLFVILANRNQFFFCWKKYRYSKRNRTRLYERLSWLIVCVCIGVGTYGVWNNSNTLLDHFYIYGEFEIGNPTNQKKILELYICHHHHQYYYHREWLNDAHLYASIFFHYISSIYIWLFACG